MGLESRRKLIDAHTKNSSYILFYIIFTQYKLLIPQNRNCQLSNMRQVKEKQKIQKAKIWTSTMLRLKVQEKVKPISHVTNQHIFKCFFSSLASMIIFFLYKDYNFWPVWVFMWRNKWLLDMNIFPQVLQWYGLSPVWVLICTNKWLLHLNIFPHVLQV